MENKGLKSSSQTPLRTDTASTVNQYEGSLLSAFGTPKSALDLDLHMQAHAGAGPGEPMDGTKSSPVLASRCN